MKSIQLFILSCINLGVSMHKGMDKEVLIDSVGKDKYGRWLGKIYIDMTQPTINDQMIALGLAKAYFGDNKLNLGW